MSTRGFIGFVVDGSEKVAYNHSDSYPGGIGHSVLAWLRKVDRDELRQGIQHLRVVAPDSKPSAIDIERLRRFGNPGVGGPITNTEIKTWYQLLRHTQGDPAAMLEAGVIEDSGQFPYDSLMCEWGYLVDLDAEMFEIYEGFQRAPHADGRFAHADRAPRLSATGDNYYPVRRVAAWPLDALPTDDEFMKLENDEES